MAFTPRAHHTLLTLCLSNFSSAYRANITYISLNIPAACPPRTVVSVNRPFCDRRGCWVTFGHELDQVCDFPNDVVAEHASRFARLQGMEPFFQCLENFRTVFPDVLGTEKTDC